jgi:hypothetical protein
METRVVQRKVWERPRLQAVGSIATLVVVKTTGSVDHSIGNPTTADRKE